MHTITGAGGYLYSILESYNEPQKMTPSISSKVPSIPFKRGSSSDGGRHGLPAAKRRKEATVGALPLPNEATHNAEPLSGSEPHPHDVLCGRGSMVNSHPGNVIFRRIIEANKEVYHSCQDHHKALLSRSIVDVIRNQTPPGRFLTRLPGSNEWVDVGNEKALQKTRDALRCKEISESIHSPQEEINNNVARPSGSANRQAFTDAPAAFPSSIARASVPARDDESTSSHEAGPLMMGPEVVLSSWHTENAMPYSIARSIVPAGEDEGTNSSEADAATMEDSERKFDWASGVEAVYRRNNAVAATSTNSEIIAGFDLDDLGDPLFVFQA